MNSDIASSKTFEHFLTPPLVLYHYCSNATLLSILQSGEIHLSLLSLSNDTHEGRWLRNVVAAELTKRAVSPFCIDKILSTFDSMLLHTSAVGFCLSAEVDTLSQWRGYAEDGMGVAIGFSSSRLLTAISEWNGNACPTVFGNVRYLYQEQAGLISHAMDALADISRSLTLVPDGLFFSEHSRQANEAAASAFRAAVSGEMKKVMSQFYLAKNPAFKEEAEWRIVRSDIWGGVGDRFASVDFDYKVRSNSVVPFVKLKMGDLMPFFIKSIWLGPKNSTPLPVIRALAEKFGLRGVEFKSSKASYR